MEKRIFKKFKALNDDFWNTDSSVSDVSEKSRCTNEKRREEQLLYYNPEHKGIDVNNLSYIKREMIEQVVNDYNESNPFSKSIKRQETIKLFLVESLLLILNSFKYKRAITFRTNRKSRCTNEKRKGNQLEGKVFKLISQAELQTLSHSDHLRTINILLETICIKKSINGRNYFSIKPEFINHDENIKVTFVEKINPKTGEVRGAIGRWHDQQNYFKMNFESGQNIEIEKKYLFEKKYLTPEAMTSRLMVKVKLGLITENDLKLHQKEKSLEDNVKNWANHYKNCLTKLETVPASFAQTKSRIYTGLNCMPKHCRIALDEVNKTAEVDVASAFPNILLSICLGTLNPSKMVKFDDSSVQRTYKYCCSHFQKTISKEAKTELLEKLGGKFRQKLSELVDMPNPKQDLMTYLNCTNNQFEKMKVNKEITNVFQKSEGGKTLVELIKYMKQNKKSDLMLIVEKIEAVMMQEFAVKLHNLNIPVNLLHDAVSVPEDKKELVEQMLEEHLTEWGIPTPNNLEELKKRIK